MSRAASRIDESRRPAWSTLRENGMAVSLPTHRRTMALHRLIGGEQSKRVGTAGREELAFAADGLTDNRSLDVLHRRRRAC